LEKPKSIKSVEDLTFEDLEAKNKYVSQKVFIEFSQDYIGAIKEEEIAIVAIFDETKNFQYLVATQKSIQNYFVRVFNRHIDNYYKLDTVKKFAIRKKVDEDIAIFIENEKSLVNLILKEEDFYKKSEELLKKIDNEEYAYITIESEKDDVYIYSFKEISDFLEKISEKIRPKRLAKIFSDEQKVLLRIAPSLVLFNGVKEMDLLHIVKKIKFYKYHDGEKIYDHRERVETLDYILKGRVNFFTYQGEYIGRLDRKNIFGEKIFDTSHMFRHSDVFAKGDVILVSISLDFQKKDRFWKTYLKLYENAFKTIGKKLDTLAGAEIKERKI